MPHTKHPLTSINGSTGICGLCGPVDIRYPTVNGIRVPKCAVMMEERRQAQRARRPASSQPWKHRLSNIRIEEKLADCAHCGPESLLRWVQSKNQWKCDLGIREHSSRRYDTPEEARVKFIRRRYGMEPEEFDRLLEDQAGGCAICGEQCSTGRALAIDHCHTSGRIRGLLCTRCNQGLGHFRDRPDLLVAAAAYLTK